MPPYGNTPEDDEDPEAWADYAEDEGVLDTLPIGRRKFIALAHGFGGAAALTALAGCSGGDGGDGSGDGSGGDGGGGTTTPEETQQQKTTPAGEMETMTIAEVPVSASLPLYIAKEKYLPEMGIELKLNRAVSGSKATAQAATGQIEGIAGATGASTMNAINQGVGIKGLCDRTRFIPDRQSTLAFLARKEVYEDGFDLSDAGGMTWATNATSSVGHHHVARALKAHGLTWDDIEFKTLPFPQMVSALSSGAVDIVQEVGALVGVAKGKAGAKHVEWTVETTPNSQVAFIQAGAPFLNQRPETARKFTEGYLKATRYMYDQGPYSQEMIDIWTKYTDNPPAALLGGVPPWASKNGTINGDSLIRQQEFWMCIGDQDKLVPKKDLLATDLLNDALDNVGRADPEFVPLETWKQWQKNVDTSFPPLGKKNVPKVEDCGGGTVKGWDR